MNLGLEQYVALGDGLSNDLFPSVEGAPGAATLFAQDLARTYGCPRHKNLSEVDTTLGSIYRKQMPFLPESRGEVVVTIAAGMVDLSLTALELPNRSQILRSVDELVAGYGGMIKAIRRKLPAALIIVSNIPDPYAEWRHPKDFSVAGTLYFNQKLAESMSGRTNVVVADLFSELQGPAFFLEQSPTNPNGVGAEAIRSAWLKAIRSSNYIEQEEAVA